MSNKRLDIQGIRAWAVIAVVIFHFFPSILPWGYLGVDVFFVLSGFLISLVLERKPRIASTYFDFYFKRFKRIFPLALLTTFILLIIIYQKEELKQVIFGTRSAIFALLFGTNYNVRDEGEDYFEALEQANDYFTHYWSLSVEIQFYTVAPLLLHILMPASNHPFRILLFISSVVLCSLTLSLSLPPEDAFSSTLCRLWQFLAGATAFNLGQMTMEHQPLPQNDSAIEPPTNFVLAIPLATLSAASIIVFTLGDYTSLIRLSVTAAATTLLVSQSTTPILCHHFIQLIGDASYALYLIHWPVVCILKDWEVEGVIYILVAMITCVALSIAVHLTFEKWYLSLSELRTLALVGGLYLLCIWMVIQSRAKPQRTIVYSGKFNPSLELERWEPGRSSNYTQDQVQQMNKILGDQLTESLTIPNCTVLLDKEKNDRFQFCHFPSGRGSYSFLIIGNSYALSPGKLVLKHFKKHYGPISIRAVPHCEPLIETKDRMCRDVHLAHRKFIEDMEREKPDVLFISSRYENPGAAIVGNVSTDPLYLYMFNKLMSYEKLVKRKVFILNSFPLLVSPVTVEKARLAKKLPIEGFMPEAIRADDEPMRTRNVELAKKCKKCVFYDIRSSHINTKGQFTTVDPISKLRYFEHSVHYTSVGLKLIDPVFREMSKHFTQLLDSKFPDNLFHI